MAAIGNVPKIVWQSGSANTLAFGYPLDNAIADSIPRQGSEKLQLDSGVEVAWTIGTDFKLSCTVRWIPTTAGTTQFGAQTGWDDVDGWEAFLRDARDGNLFAFYPDKDDLSIGYTSSLVEPYNQSPTLEPADGTRAIQFVIRNPDTPYQGY